MISENKSKDRIDRESYLTVEPIRLDIAGIKRKLRSLFLQLREALRPIGHPPAPFDRYLEEYYIDEKRVDEITFIAGEIRRLVKICQILLIRMDSQFLSAAVMAAPIGVFAQLEKLLEHIGSDGTVFDPIGVKQILIKIQGGIEEVIGLLDFISQELEKEKAEKEEIESVTTEEPEEQESEEE
mgnify:CR=1 FL=1